MGGGVGRRFRVYIRGKRKVGENIIRLYLVLQMRQYTKRARHAVLFQRTHWIPAASSAAVTVLQFGTGHEGGGVSTCFFYLQFLQKNITLRKLWEKNKIGGHYMRGGRWSFSF